MLFFKGIEAREAAEPYNCAAWGWGWGRVTCFGEFVLHVCTATATLPALRLGRGPVPKSSKSKVCEEILLKEKFILPREEKEVLL